MFSSSSLIHVNEDDDTAKIAMIIRGNGAAEGTRTLTPFGTTPSRWRVYQFHHRSMWQIYQISIIMQWLASLTHQFCASLHPNEDTSV